MIRTPAVFTIDPRRYETESGFDFALLAADLDVMGYPDEIVEAILALDEDHKPAPRQDVSFKPGDLVGGYAVMHDADGNTVRRQIISGSGALEGFDVASGTWKRLT